MVMTLRRTKGSALTHQEMDANFEHVNQDNIREDLESLDSGSVGSGMVAIDQTLTYTPTSSIGFMIARQRRWNPAGYPWRCKFDGTTNDDAMIIQCLADIYSYGGGVMVCPPGVCRVSSVVYEFAAAISVSIEGAGQHATYFQKIGSSTDPVFNLSCPTSNMDRASHFSDFSVIGSLTAGGSSIGNCDGIRLTNFANFIIELVEVRQAQVCLDLVGTLVASFKRFSAATAQTGIRTRNGSGVYANTLTFADPQVRDCHTLGWDIGDANQLYVHGGNTEICGTTGDTATGGVFVRDTVDNEFGHSVHKWQAHHFELNLGRTFQVANATALRLSMDSITALSPESGRALNVGTIATINIDNSSFSGNTAEVVLAASASCIRDSTAATWSDTSSFRHYERVSDSTGFINNGTSAVGEATLVAGTVDVSYPLLRAGDKVFITHQQDGGVVGFHRVVSKTANTGFRVNSSNAGDTSTFAWEVKRSA